MCRHATSSASPLPLPAGSAAAAESNAASHGSKLPSAPLPPGSSSGRTCRAAGSCATRRMPSTCTPPAPAATSGWGGPGNHARNASKGGGSAAPGRTEKPRRLPGEALIPLPVAFTRASLSVHVRRNAASWATGGSCSSCATSSGEKRRRATRIAPRRGARVSGSQSSPTGCRATTHPTAPSVWVRLTCSPAAPGPSSSGLPCDPRTTSSPPPPPRSDQARPKAAVGPPRSLPPRPWKRPPLRDCRCTPRPTQAPTSSAFPPCAAAAAPRSRPRPRRPRPVVQPVPVAAPAPGAAPGKSPSWWKTPSRWRP